MVREKERTVRSWDELVKFIDNINYFQKTLVLTGWVREPTNGGFLIRKLSFTTAPVEIIKELKQNDDSSKPKGKRKTKGKTK